jgi:hypothetical protein
VILSLLHSPPRSGLSLLKLSFQGLCAYRTIQLSMNTQDKPSSDPSQNSLSAPASPSRIPLKLSREGTMKISPSHTSASPFQNFLKISSDPLSPPSPIPSPGGKKPERLLLFALSDPQPRTNILNPIPTPVKPALHSFSKPQPIQPRGAMKIAIPPPAATAFSIFFYQTANPPPGAHFSIASFGCSFQK